MRLYTTLNPTVAELPQRYPARSPSFYTRNCRPPGEVGELLNALLTIALTRDMYNYCQRLLKVTD
jgi:hypothetical protein